MCQSSDKSDIRPRVLCVMCHIERGAGCAAALAKAVEIRFANHV